MTHANASDSTPESRPSDPASSDSWYIIKQADGHCEITQAAIAEAADQWGPFASRGEAIARRIGLIRAGKCQPQ